MKNLTNLVMIDLPVTEHIALELLEFPGAVVIPQHDRWHHAKSLVDRLCATYAPMLDLRHLTAIQEPHFIPLEPGESQRQVEVYGLDEHRSSGRIELADLVGPRAQELGVIIRCFPALGNVVSKGSSATLSDDSVDAIFQELAAYDAKASASADGLKHVHSEALIRYAGDYAVKANQSNVLDMVRRDLMNAGYESPQAKKSALRMLIPKIARRIGVWGTVAMVAYEGYHILRDYKKGDKINLPPEAKERVLSAIDSLPVSTDSIAAKRLQLAVLLKAYLKDKGFDTEISNDIAGVVTDDTVISSVELSTYMSELKSKVKSLF